MKREQIDRRFLIQKFLEKEGGEKLLKGIYLDVFFYILEGFSETEIERKIFVSKTTLHSRKKKIYSLLGFEGGQRELYAKYVRFVEDWIISIESKRFPR